MGISCTGLLNPEEITGCGTGREPRNRSPRPPRDHVHAADRGARDHLEFAWSLSAGLVQPLKVGRRVIMCMLLIAVLAIIWNLLGH